MFELASQNKCAAGVFGEKKFCMRAKRVIEGFICCFGGVRGESVSGGTWGNIGGVVVVLVAWR